MRRDPLAALLLAGAPAVLSLACSSAYYGALSKLGIEKRDLLVDRVEDARESQAEAKEQFRDALEAFKSLTGFEGGDLEDAYEELEGEYEASSESAEEVVDRIASIEKVADDLFEEWEDEIGTMQDARLKRDSRELLDETRVRYADLEGAMKKAAKSMDQVLTALHDHVLYLKHNLNARAIASLEGELGKIEGKVAALVAEMEASIAEADEFLEAFQSDS